MTTIRFRIVLPLLLVAATFLITVFVVFLIGFSSPGFLVVICIGLTFELIFIVLLLQSPAIILQFDDSRFASKSISVKGKECFSICLKDIRCVDYFEEPCLYDKPKKIFSRWTYLRSMYYFDFVEAFVITLTNGDKKTIDVSLLPEKKKLIILNFFRNNNVYVQSKILDSRNFEKSKNKKINKIFCSKALLNNFILIVIFLALAITPLVFNLWLITMAVCLLFAVIYFVILTQHYISFSFLLTIKNEFLSVNRCTWPRLANLKKSGDIITIQYKSIINLKEISKIECKAFKLMAMRGEKMEEVDVKYHINMLSFYTEDGSEHQICFDYLTKKEKIKLLNHCKAYGIDISGVDVNCKKTKKPTRKL